MRNSHLINQQPTTNNQHSNIPTMAIELEFITNRMAANAKAIEALLGAISDTQTRWQPDVESWSLLEVICHLHDEEREDFRQRIDYMLHKPGVAWPPIDSAGWVISREYRNRDPREMLHAWLDERARSLEWLATLKDANWDTEAQAPWGVVHAGDLLAAWLAHDHLHIRQMNELHYAYHKAHALPFNVEYAGEW
jgi:hypothetical protein